MVVQLFPDTSCPFPGVGNPDRNDAEPQRAKITHGGFGGVFGLTAGLGHLWDFQQKSGELMGTDERCAD